MAGHFPGSVTYEEISSSHNQYDPEYWKVLQALYKGGTHLLRNHDIMLEVFPPHMYESSSIYAERLKRSFYVNYCGEILDYMVSALTTHPLKVWAEAPVDEYYKSFFNDISFPGGNRITLNMLIRKQVITALVYRRSWTLVDFPADEDSNGIPDPKNSSISEAEQRALGKLDAYAVSIDPSNVIDWDEGSDGGLLWVKTCFARQSKNFKGVGDSVTKDYTVYTDKEWATYSITYDPRKPPTKKTTVELLNQGKHSFGKVPFVRLELPYGLWAMNKLESLAREHMNKRCALAWAEYKTLYPVLYEFEQGADEDCDVVRADGGASGQIRGIGYVQTRAEKDRAQYIGPDSAPFKSALDSLKDLRDEMHRIMHQMALSFDNHALALRRSGNSKQQDKKDSYVVLNTLGQLVREHVLDIYKTISSGRKENIDWVVSGLDEYDEIDTTETILQADTVGKLQIPSKTFNSKYQYRTAEAILGEKASRETLKKIEQEIISANSDDIDRLLAEDKLSNKDTPKAPESAEGFDTKDKKPQGGAPEKRTGAEQAQEKKDNRTQDDKQSN